MGRAKQEGYRFPRNVLSRRRAELDISIVEAAARIGVHPRTWKSYETGAAVPIKHLTDIMTAMEWFSDEICVEDNLEDFKKAHDWSKQLEEQYGVPAAICFALGSEALRSAIKNDCALLSKLDGKNPHVGHLGKKSEMKPLLPDMFLKRYNRDFLLDMDKTLTALIERAMGEELLLAYTVLEEVTLFSVFQLAKDIFKEYNCEKMCPPIPDYDDIESDEEDECTCLFCSSDDWVYEVFGDGDIVDTLYDPIMDDVPEDSEYHFNNWKVPVFYS